LTWSASRWSLRPRYGIQKDRIARMLKDETADGGLVTTSVHPGHIVGPGRHPTGRSGTSTRPSGTRFRLSRPPRSDYAESSWGHLHRSHCFTIEEAKSLLGYAPRYEPEQAGLESVNWLVEHGQLRVARPLGVLAG
jgi:nucleoside-diphosphate-sugar epimerase